MLCSEKWGGGAPVKRELVNDDLVALLADVVLVEKTVRMANLSKRELVNDDLVALLGDVVLR